MTPTVTVLLATYNGLLWLPAQVESILQQVEVNVLLFVSDDHSLDGTWPWLQQLAAQDCRVTLLPQTKKFGSAATNFYRLLVDADIKQCDYVAFSDQDDIWELDKLARHIRLAKRGKFDAVSSNVRAFWSEGKSVTLVKSQPQRELDFLFGSAGPGCTYLMTKCLVDELRLLLFNPISRAREVALHDWLVYAVCRSSGRRWYIDETPSVLYRQHSSNEFGANHGIAAKLSRIRKIRKEWYRSEILKIVNVCLDIKPNDQNFLKLQKLLNSNSAGSQLQLLSYVTKARRSSTDRMLLAGSIILFWF